MKYTEEQIKKNLAFWKNQLNEAKEAEKENENPNYFKNIQSLLNVLISEEWLAANTYQLFITSLPADDRNKVSNALADTARDELYDHMSELISFAEKFGYDYPTTYKEFVKYAKKSEVKLFENFKKKEELMYYLKEVLEAEKRAIKTYEEALEDDNIEKLPELQMILKSIHTDEIEHYETFKFIIYTIEANMDYNSQE